MINIKPAECIHLEEYHVLCFPLYLFIIHQVDTAIDTDHRDTKTTHKIGTYYRHDQSNTQIWADLY